jgi:hypothetical protein
MEIKISGKECEQILRDYAFVNFGKLLGCEKVDSMEIDIDCSYNSISKMDISKKEPELKNESEA